MLVGNNSFCNIGIIVQKIFRLGFVMLLKSYIQFRLVLYAVVVNHLVEKK